MIPRQPHAVLRVAHAWLGRDESAHGTHHVLRSASCVVCPHRACGAPRANGTAQRKTHNTKIMRHRKKGKKLGRTSSHRKATLQALSSALIEHKRIRTTVSKAKALRPFVEPLITRAKEDTEHNRRQVFRRLQNKTAVRELFDEIGEQVAGRPGGYVRIVKLGKRSGDGTEEALVELVDYNDVQPSTASSSSGSTRRGSGKGRRQDEEETEEAAAGAA